MNEFRNCNNNFHHHTPEHHHCPDHKPPHPHPHCEIWDIVDIPNLLRCAFGCDIRNIPWLRPPHHHGNDCFEHKPCHKEHIPICCCKNKWRY